jgi:alpha-tubulin suppressor-like RCC1 family protein
VAAGEHFSLAILGDGSVWAWGDNASNQLGNTTVSSSGSNIPVPVMGLPYKVVALAAGSSIGCWHTLALLNDGSVWAWGDNSGGQLGNGTSKKTYLPGKVQGLPDAVLAMAAGDQHSLVLLRDGTIWAWGNNSSGQLGNYLGGAYGSNQPVPVIGLPK